VWGFLAGLGVGLLGYKIVSNLFGKDNSGEPEDGYEDSEFDEFGMLKEWDESQVERDELGQFASDGGGGDGGDGVNSAGGGGAIDSAKSLGYSVVPTQERVETLMDSIKEATINRGGIGFAPDKEEELRNRLLETTLLSTQYTNGKTGADGIFVSVPHEVEEALPGYTESILETVNNLSEVAPIKFDPDLPPYEPLRITAVQSLGSGHAGAYNDIDNSIKLFPLEINASLENLASRPNWFTPGQKINEQIGTLAHEWGHAIDGATGTDRFSSPEGNNLPPNWKDAITDYGKNNPSECFAELFAQSYMEKFAGAPPAPFADTFADVKGLIQ
jgi:hypothetical protein